MPVGRALDSPADSVHNSTCDHPTSVVPWRRIHSFSSTLNQHMELFNRMPLQLIARPGGAERSGHGRVHLHRARPQTGAGNHWKFGLSAFWARRRGFEDLISPLEVGILQHFDVDNLNSLVKAVAIPVTSQGPFQSANLISRGHMLLARKSRFGRRAVGNLDRTPRYFCP